MMLRPSLLASLSFVLLASTAQAQTAAPAAGAAAPAPGATAAPAGKQPKWMMACQAEIEKHCKTEAAQGTAPSCLEKHEVDLGEACQDAFIRPRKVAALCKGDIEKFCAEAGKQGGLGKCLKEKEKELSAPCRSALLKGSKEHKSEEKAEEKAEAKATKATGRHKKK